ncbi:MAG: hypothetical protein LUH82_07065 [Clostridiales bacterium]|nr:hypothetical protein [Clostridiales bacterium]
MRFVQLYKFTNSESGNIFSGGESSICAYYALLFIFIVCVSVYASFCEVQNPFSAAPSKPLQLCSFAAGISMFYDFVRQCLNCYYYVQNEYLEYVYLFFIALNALFALVSAFYFFTMAASFNTPSYNFALLGVLHTAPFLWAFSRLFYCLSIIVNPIYSQENVLSFILIALLTLFFMLYLLLVDSKNAKPKPTLTAVLGFIYSFIAVSISLPRLILYFFYTELYNAYYSAVTYFVTGVFVFAFSSSILISNRKV